MNIYRINLNLLKIFVVLIREQHVSAAAKNLHLTQSAISNSLQQLRELFKDELLIRGPKKMVPTKKALFLAPQVEKILNQLDILLFYADEFDYRNSMRTFNLGMTDYAEYVLLPKVYEQIKKVAPKLTLKISTFNKFSPEDFEHEALELGIGLEQKIPKQLRNERLFGDKPICVAHANHSIFKQPLTLENYLQAEHLVTCVYSPELTRADQALKKLKLERNVRLTMQNALPALEMLARSELIGTFSKKLIVQSQKKYSLKYTATPFEIPEFHIAQIWHRQHDNDSGLIWLRALIKDICNKHLSD